MNPKQCTKRNSLPILLKNGKDKLLICNLCEACSNGGTSIATDKNDENHRSTTTLSEMVERYVDDVLYITTRGELINASYISKELTTEINFNFIVMENGDKKWLSVRNREAAERLNKKLKHTCWLDLLTAIHELDR